ncbi:MAG: hypothetical protein IJ302_02560 [Clostridia bacterium]|nr:hypothetical protein [Clostridia bacterium]
MKKKFISLALLAGLVLSSFTACGASETDEDVLAEAETRTATITLTAITGDSTTPDAIEAVQKAMNKLTKSEYKTQVILQLKTEDEYEEFIASQVELIEAEILAEEEAAAKAKEEAKAKKEAEKAANANKKNRSKWTTTTKAETEETTADTQEMTLDEYGREVAKYPELEGTSLDIVFVTGLDMLQDFVEKEYLQDISSELTSNSKILNKYIYPTFLNAGKVDGSTYAVVNNRLMGEYTYLLIDRELADKYELDAEAVTKLLDCEAFLDAVKAGEPDVVPLSEAVDLNYVQYVTGERTVIGNVIKPNFTTATKAIPKNLFGVSDWVDHNILMDKLEDGGYIGEGDRYAIEVRKGYITTPEEENWEENYYVVEYEKPIAKDETVFTGMFAVSAYASDLERCMEIITMLNTDGDLRNIYAYGVEGENWELNEDGSVHMLNDDWSMNFYHSGNTFVGNAPESLPANYAEIGKLQNIETLTGPYMSWTYLNEDTQALYEEYLAEAEKLLAEFDSTADRAAWAEAKNAALKEDKEKVDIINKMVDTNGSDNFMTSYVDFYTSMYGG